MSPTFFEFRHPQKRAHVIRQTIYQDVSSAQPNFFTNTTQSPTNTFNIYFFSKAKAQPVAVTYNPKSQTNKTGYILTDLDVIEFDIFDYDISLKAETSEHATPEKENHPTPKPANFQTVVEERAPVLPTGFTKVSAPLKTSMRVYTISNRVSYQGQMGFIEGAQKEDSSTPKSVYFENVTETTIDTVEPARYTTSPSPFMASWRICIVNPGVISHQAEKGFIDDPQIQAASTVLPRQPHLAVKKNVSTQPALIDSDLPVLDTLKPTEEDTTTHNISTLEEAKKRPKKRLQEYKSHSLLIETLNEKYIQEIQGLKIKKKNEKKRIEVTIKRLKEKIISSVNTLVDNAKNMVSSISKIAEWETTWQEEWVRLDEKIDEIFKSFTTDAEQFNLKKRKT